MFSHFINSTNNHFHLLIKSINLICLFYKLISYYISPITSIVTIKNNFKESIICIPYVYSFTIHSRRYTAIANFLLMQIWSSLDALWSATRRVLCYKYVPNCMIYDWSIYYQTDNDILWWWARKIFLFDFLCGHIFIIVLIFMTFKWNS